MAGSWVSRRFPHQRERNGKRKNHEADNTSQIMLKIFPRMRPAFTCGSFAYCRPDAWISRFALLSRYDAMGANIVTSSARYGRRLKMANVARFAPDVPVSNPETADADRSG